VRVEDLPASGSGSCSTSSNPSRESGSYDDNTFALSQGGGGVGGLQGDWRYENLANGHGQIAYQAGPMGSMYGDQYYEPNQEGINTSWRDSYAQPARMETPSYDPEAYDPRFSAVPRRIGNAVSQV